MGIVAAYHTDVGIKKKTNQDALLMKSARTTRGQVGLFIVCDGMGGLSEGELASATVVRDFSNWFDQELPELLWNDTEESQLMEAVVTRIQHLNDQIMSYGTQKNVMLGTTVTALLVVNKDYYIFHVGDSRAYLINDNLAQLTKDQTLVALELERGNITKEQALIDPRRNVLLQCVGANASIDVEVVKGKMTTSTVFLLCSDGFYHQISEDEIFQSFHPTKATNENYIEQKAVEMIELAKNRNEIDNLTVLLVHVL